MKIKRRDISKAILALSPLVVLSSSFDGTLRRLYKRYKGELPELRTYVMFNLFGAPARWVYDNNFKPHGNDEVKFNKSIFTNYAASTENHYDPFSSATEYSTIPYKTHHMTKMWESMVYFRGQKVPMTKILDNMLTIRGVMQGTNAHPVGNVKQICVRNGELSLSGLVADASTRPIPAISLGQSPAGQAFTSELGQVQLDISYDNSSPQSNLIHFLTRSFLPDSLERTPSSEQAKNVLNLPADFDAIAEYERLIKKYTDILHHTSQTCPIAGLTDKPLLVKEFSAPSKEQLLRDLKKFTAEGTLVLETDYSKALSTCYIGGNGFVQKQFAFAEFVLLNKISSSLVLSPPKGSEICLSDIELERGVYKAEDLKIVERDGRFVIDLPNSKAAGKKQLNINLDCHGVGSFFNVISSSMFFQGYTACMMELIETLKEHSTAQDNLFENTVIHLASEFDRAVKQNEADSDHYPNSNPTSLFSGLIQKFKIIGNIRVSSEYHNQDLTLGEAAPVAEHNNELLLTENVLSSISTVLGGRELSFRHPSILQVKDKSITTHFNEPKNIPS